MDDDWKEYRRNKPQQKLYKPGSGPLRRSGYALDPTMNSYDVSNGPRGREQNHYGSKNSIYEDDLSSKKDHSTTRHRKPEQPLYVPRAADLKGDSDRHSSSSMRSDSVNQSFNKRHSNNKNDRQGYNSTGYSRGPSRRDRGYVDTHNKDAGNNDVNYIRSYRQVSEPRSVSPSRRAPTPGAPSTPDRNRDTRSMETSGRHNTAAGGKPPSGRRNSAGYPNDTPIPKYRINLENLPPRLKKKFLEQSGHSFDSADHNTRDRFANNAHQQSFNPATPHNQTTTWSQTLPTRGRGRLRDNESFDRDKFINTYLKTQEIHNNSRRSTPSSSYMNLYEPHSIESNVSHADNNHVNHVEHPPAPEALTNGAAEAHSRREPQPEPRDEAPSGAGSDSEPASCGSTSLMDMTNLDWTEEVEKSMKLESGGSSSSSPAPLVSTSSTQDPRVAPRPETKEAKRSARSKRRDKRSSSRGQKKSDRRRDTAQTDIPAPAPARAGVRDRRDSGPQDVRARERRDSGSQDVRARERRDSGSQDVRARERRDSHRSNRSSNIGNSRDDLDRWRSLRSFSREQSAEGANWCEYAAKLDSMMLKVTPLPQNYDLFVEAVHTVSRQCIPRGCRTSYIPGLTPDSAKVLARYETLYNEDPFSEETIQSGEELISLLSEARRTKWIQSLANIDMTHNSKKAWASIRKLTTDPPPASQQGTINANQVAHQLLLNGKPPRRIRRTRKKPNQEQAAPESPGDPLSKPITLNELMRGIKGLKVGKAAGVDDITVEQLKNLGPATISWLLKLFNNCLSSAKIPKLWRKSKIVALLKPGKLPVEAKNFRPISLLCHTYKLLERLLLNRLSSRIDPMLIPEQAGFRPGKSCTNQTLKLAQYIEDGFEQGLVTGVVFVDLSAAYDTVNIGRLLGKVQSLTKDNDFVRFLGEMLQNRRFQVSLYAKKSRWRIQKNGLPQGSVLAPILFNIYTNDQPQDLSSFLYADDLALATQTKSFEEAEDNLGAALEGLGKFYEDNALKPNPSKTESCVFHLRNRQAQRTLNITWRGTKIEHNDHPKYLGITLDRALTFKWNCVSLKRKVSSRNNLLRKLTSTKWGASPDVLRTTGLALCYSAGEFACPVWARSAHCREVDVALNDTCRTITGCLKPTPVWMLYSLCGIAPPDVRREAACSREKHRQETDPRHPLYNQEPAPYRLKSRKSFLRSTVASHKDPSKERIDLWQAKYPMANSFIPPNESLPPGHELPWATWKSLNRLRTNMGRCGENMCRWGYRGPASNICACGASPQTMEHLMVCPGCPNTCTREDLLKANQRGIDVAAHWAAEVRIVSQCNSRDTSANRALSPRDNDGFRVPSAVPKNAAWTASNQKKSNGSWVPARTPSADRGRESPAPDAAPEPAGGGGRRSRRRAGRRRGRGGEAVAPPVPHPAGATPAPTNVNWRDEIKESKKFSVQDRLDRYQEVNRQRLTSTASDKAECPAPPAGLLVLPTALPQANNHNTGREGSTETQKMLYDPHNPSRPIMVAAQAKQDPRMNRAPSEQWSSTSTDAAGAQALAARHRALLQRVDRADAALQAHLAAPAAAGDHAVADTRLKQFIALNEIDTRLHVATLVTVVGEVCYELMCDLCAPDLPEDKTFDELVQIVKVHLEPQRSEIAERHVFRQRKQLHGETISDYLQNLKHLAKSCNFANQLEINLRDQFVSGLHNEEMRSRLFAEKNIDYKRAVELALALEAAERHAACAGAAGGAAAAGSSARDDGLHRVAAAPARGSNEQPPPRRQCSRCGKPGHVAGRCRYKHYSCDQCGEKGHLKVVCHKKSDSARPSRGQYFLEESDVEDCNFYNLVSEEEDPLLQQLRDEFPTVFAGGLGTYRSRMRFHLADETPVFVKARPLPLALRPRVEQELERLQREGVIYKVERSDYGTPIVPVVKSNGDIRVCGDYKITINKRLKEFHYPLPRIDEIFTALGGGEQYTKLDLSHAYQQVLLSEESQPMTAITTHIGTFVYKRVPFGINCVPENFQKLMEETLSGVPTTVVFQDDICITGRDKETHLHNLRQVLNRLKDAGLRINWSKCEFFKQSVTYLGYRIDKDGLHTDERKIKAIVAAPTPENVTQLKGFLGLVNFYSKFFSNLSSILKPLYNLLKSNVKWVWSESCKVAFDKAKELLGSKPVLAHYDASLPLILSVDSSAYGLGCVLAQRGADGVERPVSCASRTLNEHELNYSQFDKEALAIVFGEVKSETIKDPLLSKVMNYVKFGWPPKVDTPNERAFFVRKECLHLVQDCLVWGYRVVIPSKLRSSVLDELHEGHCGIVKMKQIARNYFWWERLDEDIERTARACAACRALADRPAPAPLHSWAWPAEPWARINIDFLGPFRNKHYLVLVDAHSKWLEVEQVSSICASVIITCLRKIFARFGLPKRCVSDNGPPFSSAEYGKYLETNGIKRILVAPYHPSSNGAAENAVRSVKNVLKKAVLDNENLDTALSKFLFTYRNTEHCTTKKEPAVALMGRRLRGRLDLLRADTAELVQDSQQRQQQRRGGDLREAQEGDHVYVRDYGKNDYKWKEGTVLKRTGPLSYVVKTKDDQLCRRHIDQVITTKKGRHSLSRFDDGTDRIREEAPTTLIDSPKYERNPMSRQSDESSSAEPTSSSRSLSPAAAAAAAQELEYFKNKHVCYRKFLQEALEKLLMTDLKYCQADNIEHHFWKILYYNFIEVLRKRLAAAAPADRAAAVAQINAIIDDGNTYFEQLVQTLEKTYKFNTEDYINDNHCLPPKGLGYVGLALVSVQKLYVFLGDLARYKEQVNETNNYAKSKFWYTKAQQVNPKNGRPYNQLAILAIYARRKLDAVYYYMRSLMSSNPFHSARESLISLFDENRKKYEAAERKRRALLEANNPSATTPAGAGAGRGLRREVWVRPSGGRTTRLRHDRSPDDRLDSMTPVELNKNFITSYLHVHGKLVTKIGMESFHASSARMLREFRALLHLQPLPTPAARLLQLTALNMFAVETNAPSGTQRSPGGRGHDAPARLTGRALPNMFINRMSVSQYILLRASDADKMRQKSSRREALKRVVRRPGVFIAACYLYRTGSHRRRRRRAAGSAQTSHLQPIILASPLESSTTNGCRSAWLECAVSVALLMFGALLERCCALLPAPPASQQRADALLLLPAIKVWSDWMLCHSSVWNPPPSFDNYDIGADKDPWDWLARLMNILETLDDKSIVFETEMKEGYSPVRLPEDSLLAGFTPLMYMEPAAAFVRRAPAPAAPEGTAPAPPAPLAPHLAEHALRTRKLLFFGTEYLVGVEPAVLRLECPAGAAPRYASCVPRAAPPPAPLHALSEDSAEEEEDDMKETASPPSPPSARGTAIEAEGADEATRRLLRRKEQLEDRRATMERRQKRMQELVAGGWVRAEVTVRPRWLVPDTNCFIEHLPLLTLLARPQPYLLAVPLVVVTELEGLSRCGRVGAAAAAALAWLGVAGAAGGAGAAGAPPGVRFATSRGSLLASAAFTAEQDTARATNDDRVLATALNLHANIPSEPESGEAGSRRVCSVVLLTDDRNLRVKALAADLPARDLPSFVAWAALTDDPRASPRTTSSPHRLNGARFVKGGLAYACPADSSQEPIPDDPRGRPANHGASSSVLGDNPIAPEGDGAAAQ
ncbi:unnamed protein product [Plutella xylostella]|uniref:RNA-directed DNA polymerase n=1 Tax=Plutella xylostella TaxID=51655 RepID=A0A8S4EFD5_PLUXY|nr:unnamed protein product [Plutella xylostella]